MECKINKQLWLESVLKKLYKKVDSLGAVETPKSHQKKKLNVPVTPLNPMNHQEGKIDLSVSRLKVENKQLKRKGNVDSHTPTPSKKQKRQSKKNHSGPSEEEQFEHNEKFWNFVDEFVQMKPFHGSTKNGFFNSVKIPSTINYKLWKSIGNTIPFPSRVICVDEFTLLGDPKDEGFLKTEISPLDEERALEEKLLLKIQKVRIKRATDAIAKEVLGERNAEKY